MQNLEVEAPPSSLTPVPPVRTYTSRKKALFACLAVCLVGCIAVVSLKAATSRQIKDTEPVVVPGVVPNSAGSSLVMMPTPWWLQYGIKPEEVEDKGSYTVVKFSPKQQEIFSVDENGEPTNDAKFEAAKAEIERPMVVNSFSKYPGYEGPLNVEGSMTVRYICHDRNWQLIWSLSGTDPACEDGPQEGVANSCGIHIHVGTDCSDMSSVGGHYHKYHQENVAGGHDQDPWSEVNVARGNQQANIDFGIQWPGVLGRVMVVHDVTGGRVACGEIAKATDATSTPPPTAVPTPMPTRMPTPVPTAVSPKAVSPTPVPTAVSPTAVKPTPVPTAVSPIPVPTPMPTDSLRLEST